MKPPFTSEDADRLLQLADQFLEDWEEDDGKDDFSKSECEARRREWDAIRPLLLAAPDMREALEIAWRRNSNHELMTFEECNKARAALGKAGAT